MTEDQQRHEDFTVFLASSNLLHSWRLVDLYVLKKTYSLFLHIIEAIIYPLQSTVILPSSITPLQLESSIVLSCGIEAPLYVPSTFWVTPQGTILDETTNDSQYFVTEGQVFQNNQRIYSTILQIGGLSYTDAGNYSCVVDTSTSTEANIRAESTVEVVLLSKHQSSTINTRRVDSELYFHLSVVARRIY